MALNNIDFLATRNERHSLSLPFERETFQTVDINNI